MPAFGSTRRRAHEDVDDEPRSWIISERTPDGRIANIRAKLGLKNRAQMVVWAVEHELVPTRS